MISCSGIRVPFFAGIISGTHGRVGFKRLVVVIKTIVALEGYVTNTITDLTRWSLPVVIVVMVLGEPTAS